MIKTRDDLIKFINKIDDKKIDVDLKLFNTDYVFSLLMTLKDGNTMLNILFQSHLGKEKSKLFLNKNGEETDISVIISLFDLKKPILSLNTDVYYDSDNYHEFEYLKPNPSKRFVDLGLTINDVIYILSRPLYRYRILLLPKGLQNKLLISRIDLTLKDFESICSR